MIANTKQPRKNKRLNISFQLLTSLRSSLRIDTTIKSKNSSTTVRAVKPKRIKQDMNRVCDSSEIKNRTKLMVRFFNRYANNNTKYGWEGVDSNHRSALPDEIYSLAPSATRTPAQMSYVINSSNINIP